MITLTNITKSYGGKTILKDVTLEMPLGKALGIIGPNGSGKTTLINIMTKNLKADQGQVTYQFPETDFATKVGIQMQDGMFEEYVKVGELVAIYCHLYRLSLDVGENFLREFGLADLKKTYLTKLSGGEKQKVTILLSLIHDPDFLFFDEITTGLDGFSRKKLLESLLEIKKTGKSLVLVSHYYEEIWKLCDELLVLSQGQTLFYGKILKIADNYSDFSEKIDQLVGESR